MHRILFVISLMLALGVVPAAGQDTGHYRVVENWVQFPPEVTKWGSATGVDVDSHDNLYVFHRNDAMPIMAFDRNGKFVRAWGKGMFTTTHFLRTDRDGNVWVTDRGAMTAYKFAPDGKLLLTIGQKAVKGDNESKEAYNGMADLAVAKNGDIYIADGEGPNTRVVKLSKDGTFIKWWGGKGTGPGQFDVPHSITMDGKGRVYVADRSNNRVQIFDKDGKFLSQWTHLGVPWGITVKDDLMYLVDGTENNCLLIVQLKDGKVIDRVEGLSNATAVAVDSHGAIYIGEVNGTNVKKLVKK
ncbi:MAG: peptidyl-alpha-hydroxyglycine alpha-amidating lyase family protein [Vicinamibacterales bacterium]|nr:peptidyl-alpha-hydroxyglycine alpha-amidating lyase family protein [Vicinamibacterales bacterium]